MHNYGVFIPVRCYSVHKLFDFFKGMQFGYNLFVIFPTFPVLFCVRQHFTLGISFFLVSGTNIAFVFFYYLSFGDKFVCLLQDSPASILTSAKKKISNIGIFLKVG